MVSGKFQEQYGSDVILGAAPARSPRVAGSCKSTRRWTLAAALGLLFGCSADGEPCSTGESCELAGEVRVATWWATRGELLAPFDILKASLRRSTGLEVALTHRFQSKDEHTDWVEKQLDPNNFFPDPLDVFSANNGDEVLRWTPCAASGTPPGTTRLLPLTDPALGVTHLDAKWIDDTFRAEVMRTLECDGRPYALPVGIHRINTLFFNKDLFRAAGYGVEGESGLPMPRTIDELVVAAAAIREHLPLGTPFSSLQPAVFALPGRDSWTLSLFIIENLMLALAADEQHYQRFWQGEACDLDLVRATLAELARLRPYFGNAELSSADALNRVASGQAAMVVMGDWASADLPPEAVGAMPFPGTQRYFVFTADVFALPAIASSDPSKGLAWLRAVTGEQTQREFSLAKNALPARSDLGEEPAAADGSAPIWVRSLPAILPYYEGAPFASMQDELQSWLNSGEESGDALLAYASDEYLKLSHGQVSCDASADPSTIIR